MASCHQLTSRAGGDRHLPHGSSHHPYQAGEGEKSAWQGILFFFQDSFWLAPLLKRACSWTRLCQKGTRANWHTSFAIIGNHILGYVSLTLRREHPGAMGQKPLWTGLKSASLQQKQCRDKPRPWDPISNFDGSSCLHSFGSAASCCSGVQMTPARPPSTSFPAMLPPLSFTMLWALGMTLTSNITNYSWNQLHVNGLWESQITVFPVTLAFYLSC